MERLLEEIPSFFTIWNIIFLGKAMGVTFLLTAIGCLVGFSVGGFTDQTKVYFSLSDKKGMFSIGTYHLNELFKQDKTSMSGYIKLSTRF